MSFYLSGSQQGTYNTLSKHLPYIFGWKENEEDEEGKRNSDFYFGLINSSKFKKLLLLLLLLVVSLGAVFV